MEFHRANVSFFTFLFIFNILFTSSAALRPLHEKPLIKKYYGFWNLINQSLDKGPVPPIGGSPCTHIPGGTGHCPNLNGMNFAGRVARAPPPLFPGSNVIDFPVASPQNKNNEKDTSS